jgi:hypothetical protein
MYLSLTACPQKSITYLITRKDATSMSDSMSEQEKSGLLKDETFQAIYNAFQLGWSLYELKSRILLASFDVELQALPNAESQPPEPANQYPLLAFIDDLFKQARQVNALPLPFDNPTLLDNDKPVLPEAASENDWLRSVWRALFKQIADLHVRCKLEEKDENDQDNSALYGYPATEEAKQNYPYLYFQNNNIEYPKLGMPATVDETIFNLPDLVYRALNCLVLLYTDPQETLSPEIVKAYQRKLLDAFNPSWDALNAKKLLSGFVSKLLVIWDNYVRERLYSGGVIKNDEIELVAYEAGRSMGSLQWGISVRTVVLENMLSSKSASAADAKTMEPYKQQLSAVWQDVFNQRNIVHIQHQISALGQAMDDAYYNVIPGAQRPGASKSNDSVVDDAQLTPQLPTRSIHAICHSLDYWLRSIQWLAQPDVQQVIRAGDKSTGTQSILTVELAHDLRVALIQQGDVWHSLMTYEQNLSNFTAKYVTLNILNDFMVDLEQAMKKRASSDMPVLIGLGVFALIALIAVVISVAVNQSSGTQPAIIAFIVAALAAGGRVAMSWLTKLRGIFGASGSAISDALERGYKQLLVEFGDLNYNVAISIALVAFFVVDANVLWKEPASPQDVVNDAYSFLTKIIWTAQERKQEIDHVAVAAFGPLGALVGEQLGTSGQGEAKQKT